MKLVKDWGHKKGSHGLFPFSAVTCINLQSRSQSTDNDNHVIIVISNEHFAVVNIGLGLRGVGDK
jgi:hypothetical protein